MSRENPLWGEPRIHGELLKLGIDIGQTWRQRRQPCCAAGAPRRTTAPSRGRGARLALGFAASRPRRRERLTTARRPPKVAPVDFGRAAPRRTAASGRRTRFTVAGSNRCVHAPRRRFVRARSASSRLRRISGANVGKSGQCALPKPGTGSRISRSSYVLPWRRARS